MWVLLVRGGWILGLGLGLGLVLGLSGGSLPLRRLLIIGADVLPLEGDLDGGAEALVVAVLHDGAQVHVFRHVAFAPREVQNPIRLAVDGEPELTIHLLALGGERQREVCMTGS